MARYNDNEKNLKGFQLWLQPILIPNLCGKLLHKFRGSITVSFSTR